MDFRWANERFFLIGWTTVLFMVVFGLQIMLQVQFERAIERTDARRQQFLYQEMENARSLEQLHKKVDLLLREKEAKP